MKWPPDGDRRRQDRSPDLDDVRATTEALRRLVEPLRENQERMAELLEELLEELLQEAE